MAELIFRGPIFTAVGSTVIDRACREAELELTKQVRRRVRALGQSSFKYEKKTYDVPGKWLTNVRQEAREDYHVVTDSGIIYGHWLEGTGSRNRTTRFKGYFMWRRTYQTMLRGDAMFIARPIIERAVRTIQ